MTLQAPSSGPGAQNEALVFLSFFADLPDPRQAGKVIYPLQEVLLLCLLAVLAGAENFVEIARFGEKKIELLRRFLPFKDGTPSHDQLCDIFAMIDALRIPMKPAARSDLVLLLCLLAVLAGAENFVET